MKSSEVYEVRRAGARLAVAEELVARAKALLLKGKGAKADLLLDRAGKILNTLD